MNRLTVFRLLALMDTLVYGAKDEAHNQAVVLREMLERMTRIGSDEGKESRGASWN